VGLRDWFYRLLNRGEPVPVEPDRLVEAGFLDFIAAQTVMAKLHERGIEAFCTEETIGPDFPARMARILSSCRRRRGPTRDRRRDDALVPRDRRVDAVVNRMRERVVLTP